MLRPGSLPVEPSTSQVELGGPDRLVNLGARSWLVFSWRLPVVSGASAPHDTLDQEGWRGVCDGNRGLQGLRGVLRLGKVTHPLLQPLPQCYLCLCLGEGSDIKHSPPPEMSR